MLAHSPDEEMESCVGEGGEEEIMMVRMKVMKRMMGTKVMLTRETLKLEV